ncbi:modification methylase [Kitasatospora sp. GAS204A]|uniref:TRM11 family SAM-dependent methyltransferase n=1 Tax=unclassified Kitasatospora TaxID=2633591 RepID=UPI0024746C41|nr:DNA methyltransferase [Kitasatospora sp. GAS204B]MDH6120275.1 modification methylase [Kitasatospora sp. GAS204B]
MTAQPQDLPTAAAPSFARPPGTLAAPVILASLPTSVWVTAQNDARNQRRDRYTPASAAHPAKMLPAIAAHAVTTYTNPGQLVLDPMCGIGTTLVEAVHCGRDAVGVELEGRWTAVARANLHLARTQGATGRASVTTGDARHAHTLLGAEHHGQVQLLLTSPPYGASAHGRVNATRDTHRAGINKFDATYGTNPANLAHAPTDELLDAFTAILTSCLPLLAPGAHVAVTARPWRHHGELVDLPAAVLAAGQAAGLTPVERCVALLAGVRDGELVARPSFFQLKNVRAARAAGVPMHLIVHEDVLVLRFPRTPSNNAMVTARQTAEAVPAGGATA